MSRIGPALGTQTASKTTSSAEALPHDPVAKLGKLQGKLGEALAASVAGGVPLSSSELGRMLNLLPSMGAADRAALYSALADAHRAMGSEAPVIAKPTAGDLLELASTPALPKGTEAVAKALAQNGAALTEVKAKLAGETNPAAKKALQAEEKQLTGRGATLERYGAALGKPLLAFTDGWKVAAERVQHQLKGMKESPHREELEGALKQLQARSAVESDPKNKLSSVPVLGSRMAELTGGGRLEANEVAKFLGTDSTRGLVDLSPPQRKALLKTIGEAMGEDVLPPKLLKVISRPVNAEHIVAVLSSAERFPKTAEGLQAALTDAKAQQANAKAGVLELTQGRAPDTLTPQQLKQFGALQTQVAYSSARIEELTARLAQLQKGLPAMPVEPWPVSVEGAAAAIGRLQTQLGERRERLIVEGPTNAPLREQLNGELEVLGAQKKTLELLHGELSQIPTLSALQSTGVTVAVNALPLKVPGLMACWGSVGVVRDPADRLTQKNDVRPYVSAGVTTPVAGLGAMYSSTVKGLQAEFNAVPGVAIGRNPLLGEFVGVCIPGVIAGTMSSNGTIGVTAYFGPVGGRLFLRNEAFAHLTQPLLEAITMGADAVVRLMEPVKRHVEDAVRPIVDAAKDLKRKVTGS